MLHLKSADLSKQAIEVLAIPVCEDKDIHEDELVKSIIKKALALKEFSGNKDEEVTLYDLPDIKARRVILRGLGKFEKLDLEALRSMAGRTAKCCIKKEFTELWLVAPEAAMIDLQMPAVLEAMQEGALLGNHIFHKYKGENKKAPLKQINFLVKPRIVKELRHLCAKVAAVCDGTSLARDWVSTPSNEKTPEKFTRSIVEYGQKAAP